MESPYKEKENHAHYIACSSRLSDIENKARKRNTYTLVTSIIAGFFGAMSVRINGYSLLVDLCDKRKDVFIDPDKYANNIVDLMASNLLTGVLTLIMAAFIILLGYVGLTKSKAKITHILLFAFYCYMIVDSIVHIGDRKTDIIAFGLGIVGVYLYYPAISEYLDFREISEAEGYPFFNLRLTEQNEHPDYEPDHRFEDSNMVNSGMNNLLYENVSLPPDSPMVKKTGSSFMDDIPDTPAVIPQRGDALRKKNAENQASAEKAMLSEKLNSTEKGRALLEDISAIAAAKKSGNPIESNSIPQKTAEEFERESRLIKPEYSKIGSLFPEKKPSKEQRRQSFLEDISAIANAKKKESAQKNSEDKPVIPRLSSLDSKNDADSRKQSFLEDISAVADAKKKESAQKNSEDKPGIPRLSSLDSKTDADSRKQSFLEDISAVANAKKEKNSEKSVPEAGKTTETANNAEAEKKELSFDEKMDKIRQEADKLRSGKKNSEKSEYEKLFDQYKV